MITFQPIPGLPLFESGDDVCAEIEAAVRRAALDVLANDIFVITQKIVSKAMGLIVDLSTVTPSAKAHEVAAVHGGDPRYVHVILSQSRDIVLVRPNLLITEHLSGAVMANAGVDRSNIRAGAADVVALLPEDPDACATALRDRLATAFDADIGVILSDSWGRPWRLGTTGTALGAAGVECLRDLRGREDLFGVELRHSMQAIGDEIAAGANLVMGQAAESVPVVLVRGVSAPRANGRAAHLLRPRDEDAFR